jgi:hypothetical protein
MAGVIPESLKKKQARDAELANKAAADAIVAVKV